MVWRLWKQPNAKVLIVSANEDLAVENATLIKLIIEHEAGDDLWAELRGGKRSSTLAFDVGNCVPDKSPSVKTVGITGQLTGSRSDILISDDVEVPKNSATEAQRDKLRHLTAEYGDIAKPGSEIIYLGTPQSMASIYKDLGSKGYAIRVWPARYPTPDRIHHYDGTLAPMLLEELSANPDLGKCVASQLGGAPTNPARFTDTVLMEKELKRRLAGFLLQYQLDTSMTDAERYPLKTRDLVVMDVDKAVAPVRVAWSSSPDMVLKDLPNVGFDGDRLHRPFYVAPEFVPYAGSVLHVDPSGRGSDDTAYIVTKFLNGLVYIRQWGGFRDGYSEDTLRTLAEIARDEEVNLVQVEGNFGDGMFSKLLEPVMARKHPVRIEDFKVTGQKEVRITTFVGPALRQHRLVLDTSVARADMAQPDLVRQGLYQLTHLTEARGSLKHDDRVDVLAQALEYWAPMMNADADKAERDFERRKEEEWEREFFKGTIIGVPGERTVSRQVRGRSVGRPAGRRRGGSW